VVERGFLMKGFLKRLTAAVVMAVMFFVGFALTDMPALDADASVGEYVNITTSDGTWLDMTNYGFAEDGYEEDWHNQADVTLPSVGTYQVYTYYTYGDIGNLKLRMDTGPWIDSKSGYLEEITITRSGMLQVGIVGSNRIIGEFYVTIPGERPTEPSIIMTDASGKEYGRVRFGSETDVTVPREGTYYFTSSDNTDIKIKLDGWSLSILLLTDRFKTGVEQIDINIDSEYGNSRTVYIAPFESEYSTTKIYVTINPLLDPTAQHVIFTDSSGTEYGRTFFGSTAFFSVPSPGTYQIKTSDNKDIKVRLGTGSWQDKDKPSRTGGEQITINEGENIVSVNLFNSSKPYAGFIVYVSASQPDPEPDEPTPDNPLEDPNAPGVIFANVGGADIGRVAYNGTTNITVPSAGTYQIKTSDSKDIKVKVGTGSWTDKDKPSRFQGEQVAITGNCTVTVQLYGSSTVAATFNVTVGGSTPSPPDEPTPDNPTVDPNAPGVIFANVGGADIGRVAYNGTTNITVPSAGTYQIKTSDSKDIKVKVGTGSWTDKDKPSRFQGEQVSITGNCTVTVQLYGSSAVAATFNVTVGGSTPSQPDEPTPDNPTVDPNAPGVIFANVGGADIGRVAYNGTTNITVPSAGTYQIKTTDSKDIKVKVGTGSWTDKDKPSRFQGEQVSITGNCTVTVQLYGSSAVAATFNVTVGGSTPSQPDEPLPSEEYFRLMHAAGGWDVADVISGNASHDIIAPYTGGYWIYSNDNRDIKVRVNNGAWIDNDAYFGGNDFFNEAESVEIGGPCTIYVALKGSDTPIASFRITTIRNSSTVNPNASSRYVTIVNGDYGIYDGVINGGTYSITLPAPGLYHIKTSDFEDVMTSFNSSAFRDYNNPYGAYFGDWVYIGSSGTITVVAKNSPSTVIATFNVTIG
jgi:hypothetical protein